MAAEGNSGFGRGLHAFDTGVADGLAMTVVLVVGSDISDPGVLVVRLSFS